MSGRAKIALALAGGACVAAAVWAALFLGLATPETTRPGPQLTLGDHAWDTRVVIPQDDDLSAVTVHLVAPQTFDVTAFDPSTTFLRDACAALLAQPAGMTDAGVSLDAVGQVDFNIDVAGQMGWIVPITVVVRDGTCVDTFRVEGVTTGDDAFSAHNSTEIFLGTFRSWGLGHPEVSFATTNGARSVQVVYPYQSAIQRDIRTFNAEDLCVHVISRWTKEMKFLGVPVDPTKYPQMVVEVVEKAGFSGAGTQRSLGSATLNLEDGRCVLAEGRG